MLQHYAVISNSQFTCKQKYVCNGYFPILYWRLKELKESVLRIHSIVAGAKIETSHQFNGDSFESKWHQSKSPEILVDFLPSFSSASFSLEVECRNIEILHDYNALILFQRNLDH